VYRELAAPPGRLGTALALGIFGLGALGVLIGQACGWSAGARPLRLRLPGLRGGEPPPPGGGPEGPPRDPPREPLRGRDLVIGGAATALRRAFPILVASAALIAASLIADLEARGAFAALAALGHLVLFGSLVLLAYGISLWMSLLVRRPGERIALSLVAFLILVLGSGILASGSSSPPYHPLHAWLASGGAGAWPIFASAAGTGALGLGLAIGFALAFRRILSR